MRTFSRWNFGIIGLGLAVAGCAAPAALPFQARTAPLAGYGYSEVKKDDAHYAVSYSDNNPQRAETFLELRAAQLAQGAGVHYFAFDKRGDMVLKRSETDINYDDVPQHGTSSGFPIEPRDLVPTNTGINKTTYYYAWGQVALLTDDQARGNAKALPVSQVLARPVMSAP